jgi:hypothetical protein
MADWAETLLILSMAFALLSIPILVGFLMWSVHKIEAGSAKRRRDG